MFTASVAGRRSSAPPASRRRHDVRAARPAPALARRGAARAPAGCVRTGDRPARGARRRDRRREPAPSRTPARRAGTRHRLLEPAARACCHSSSPRARSTASNASNDRRRSSRTLSGLGAAGLGGHRGVVQVTANLPLDCLAAVARHLRHHHGARQDQRKAGAGQQPPPVARRRIVFQRCDERRHRRPALRRIGLEPAQHRPPDPGGHLAVLGHRFEVALGHVVQQLQQRLAVERALAVERLVERHAKTELIGALVGRVARRSARAPCRPASP